MSGLGRAIDRGLHVAGRIREDWSPFALFVSVRVPGDEEEVIRLLACSPASGRARA